jgi:fumarate hydratase class II
MQVILPAERRSTPTPWTAGTRPNLNAREVCLATPVKATNQEIKRECVSGNAQVRSATRNTHTAPRSATMNAGSTVQDDRLPDSRTMAHTHTHKKGPRGFLHVTSHRGHMVDCCPYSSHAITHNKTAEPRPARIARCTAQLGED